MEIDYVLGLYSYKVRVDYSKFMELPESLKPGGYSVCALLLLLLLGKIDIMDENGEILYEQKVDYTKLPMSQETSFSYDQINNILGINVLDDESRNICNKYFIRDRKNSFVYEHILNEMTQYFISHINSPCEGFVHLYRMLEFMSYSFPLIYATKTKDYMGSYNSLKKFLKGGENTGELKFFGYFLRELFKDDEATYQYEFEVYVDSAHIEELKRDLLEAIPMDFYNFDNSTIVIKFGDVKDLFVDIRNKYFHMLLGQGSNNFLNMQYDKNDLFRSLNPIFVNWLSIIFIEIFQQGLLLYT